MKKIRVSLSLILVLTLFSCFVFRKQVFDVSAVPSHFPKMEFPTDNKFTKERWELGKKLFFDPILSLDSSISCGSCHKPSLAFSDDKPMSPGIKNRAGKRNSPSLANIGYHPYFLREGGVPTLEMQVLVPIQEHNEFNHNIVEIGRLLEKIPEYVEMSKLAYDKKPDYFVITRALGVFERTLISGNSKYDKYLNKKVKFTKKEKRGMDLFFSDKTNCFTCHSGFNFTNYGFENTGLYLNYKDIGRMRFTKDTSDMARFKVPSLRNVSVTAPYMHDGSIATLKEVIEHFNSGGKNHINKNELIKPLNLSKEEKENLVLFMETLTDYEFIENDVFR